MRPAQLLPMYALVAWAGVGQRYAPFIPAVSVAHVGFPTIAPFTNGGSPRNCDARIHGAPMRAKFELLTHNITDTTRARYMRRRGKWPEFSAGMNQSPWLDTKSPCWGGALLGFLVWVRGIFGPLAAPLLARFFFVWFSRVAEGHGDIFLRPNRVRALIKALELRGGKRKNDPINADLLWWR